MKTLVVGLLCIPALTCMQFNANAQNVGIGITSPNYPLHIHNGSLPSVLQFTSNATDSMNNDGLVIGQNVSSGEVLMWNYENQDILFGTNMMERMRNQSGWQNRYWYQFSKIQFTYSQ